MSRLVGPLLPIWEPWAPGPQNKKHGAERRRNFAALTPHPGAAIRDAADEVFSGKHTPRLRESVPAGGFCKTTMMRPDRHNRFSFSLSDETEVPSFGRHKRPFGRLRVQVLGLGPWAPLCFLFFVFPSLPPTWDPSGPPLTESSILFRPEEDTSGTLLVEPSQSHCSRLVV